MNAKIGWVGRPSFTSLVRSGLFVLLACTIAIPIAQGADNSAAHQKMLVSDARISEGLAAQAQVAHRDVFPAADVDDLSFDPRCDGRAHEAVDEVLHIVELAGLQALGHRELASSECARDDLRDDAVRSLTRTVRVERAQHHQGPAVAPVEHAAEALAGVGGISTR